MNTHAASMAPTLLATVSSGTSLTVPAAPASTAMMTCDICDLTGGPFPAAEAAHLKTIHDRLHHGYSIAA